MFFSVSIMISGVRVFAQWIQQGEFLIHFLNLCFKSLQCYHSDEKIDSFLKKWPHFVRFRFDGLLVPVFLSAIAYHWSDNSFTFFSFAVKLFSLTVIIYKKKQFNCSQMIHAVGADNLKIHEQEVKNVRLLLKTLYLTWTSWTSRKRRWRRPRSRRGPRPKKAWTLTYIWRSRWWRPSNRRRRSARKRRIR